MASISISQVSPEDYGYDSYFVAIKYTLSGAGRLHGIKAHWYDPGNYFFGTPQDLDIYEIYNQSQSGGIAMIAYFKPNASYITGIKLYLTYEDDEASVDSNTIDVSVRTDYPQILDSSFTFDDYKLSCKIVFPDGYVYNSFKFLCKFEVNGNSLGSYGSANGIFHSKEYLIEFNINKLIINYEKNSNISNNKLEVTYVYYPFRGVMEDYYISNKVSIDITNFLSKVPTTPAFNIKNMDTKFSTLFGTDNVAPYKMNVWKINLTTPSYKNSSSSEYATNYYIIDNYNTAKKTLITSNTSDLSDLQFDVSSLNSGSYTPRICAVNNIDGIDYYSRFVDCDNEINLVKYTPSSFLNISYGRLNGYEESTSTSFSAICYNMIYKNSNYNSIKTVKYRYRLAEASFGDYTTLTKSSETSDSMSVTQDFSFNLTLPSANSYYIELYVEDQVQTYTITLFIPQGIPLFCQNEEGYYGIGKIPDNTNECKLQVQSDIMGVDSNGNNFEIIKNINQLSSSVTSISQTQTNIQNDITNLNNYLYFSIGDTERCVFYGGAILTGSNKTVYVTVTTTKDMSNISSISVTSPYVNIRQGGNYLVGSASSMGTSGFSITCEKMNNKTLRLIFTFTSSIGGTNNDAVGLYFQGDLNFS